MPGEPTRNEMQNKVIRIDIYIPILMLIIMISSLTFADTVDDVVSK